MLEACEAAFVADGKGAAWRAGAGLYLDYARFREDLAAAMVALDEGAPPDAHMLAGLASSARALRSRVDGSAALAADRAVCATAGDAPDDLVLLACRSSLSSELDDAARKLDDASGLRAAAADPVDDVPVQTPHANCKQDVCIELADAPSPAAHRRSSTAPRRCAVVVVPPRACGTARAFHVRERPFRRGVEGTRARTRCSG